MRYVENRAEDVRIAYIGGGSRGWAWGLMSDLAAVDDMNGTVALYDIDREAAENTRRFILSSANPFYYEGACAGGIGSPHTPPDYIWHISLAVQGLTSPDREEKLRILRLMRDTDAGKKMMHEGFCVNDPSLYTREWFSWANAMFCELALDYCGIRVKR